MSYRAAPEDHSYLKDPLLDRLARMNMELLSELWIARDRIAVLEEVLGQKGVLEPGEIDRFQPDAAMQARLDGLRDLMVEAVLGSMDQNKLSVEDLQEIGRRQRATIAGDSAA